MHAWHIQTAVATILNTVVKLSLGIPAHSRKLTHYPWKVGLNRLCVKATSNRKVCAEVSEIRVIIRSL